MRLLEAKALASPRRVTIYLKEKGLKIERVEIDARGGATKTPEFLKINPLGKIPVLQFDDGSYLPESAAIVEYLEERFPNPPMMGDTPEQRAQIRATERIAGELFIKLPLVLLHTEQNLARSRGITPYIEVADTLRPSVDALLDLLEHRIGKEDFLAGSWVTVPDCTLFALVDTTRRLLDYRLPERLPRLRAWFDRFSARPSAEIG